MPQNAESLSAADIGNLWDLNRKLGWPVPSWTRRKILMFKARLRELLSLEA